MRHDAGVRLLLLSNSTSSGQVFLEHVRDEIADLVSGADEIAFIPHALGDHDGYTAQVSAHFEQFNVGVRQVTGQDALAVVRDSQVIFAGGGNTFRLLDALHRLGLIEAIRAAVGAGARYLGASAGANVAAPSIKTTNDMPIVEPPSFTALSLVPFQINPHFLDSQPAGRRQGETRDERLRQYLEVDLTPCLAMREGTWLRREEDNLYFEGLETGGRLYRREIVREIPTPADLSELLEPGTESLHRSTGLEPGTQPPQPTIELLPNTRPSQPTTEPRPNGD